MKFTPKTFLSLLIVGGLAAAGFFGWKYMHSDGLGEGFAGGNGRIEATEIDIAAKLAGRIDDILVQEGDFVKQGQVLAVMQTNVLEAQLHEAQAKLQQAISQEIKAKAQVFLRESDKQAAEAVVAQRASELDAGQRRLSRSSVLSQKGAVSVKDFDDDETRVHGARAAVDSAKAQVTVAAAAVEAAKADVLSAGSLIKAAQATVARIEADIRDCSLIAPRDGRIQYRIAQPGEVMGAGGKVLNLVDLSDVYMTFFLPETVAGKVALGADARLILDALPEHVVPAKISFVASAAQFTPKTVETQSERQKLMFRVKAQIDRELLLKYLTMVKTGLPGMAWVKLDPDAQWPAHMAAREAR